MKYWSQFMGAKSKDGLGLEMVRFGYLETFIDEQEGYWIQRECNVIQTPVVRLDRSQGIQP